MSEIKKGQKWLTPAGDTVTVLDDNLYCAYNLYTILVHNTVTGDIYTVARNGLWEAYYDTDGSCKDLVTLVEEI